ncbi:histidine kinase dimerization/phosphoacceptor domain -containing protein [Fodinibius sp.]|uniref:histidine kinase dimerization/phosphoacceptor domain -containing protein n=1 Tax=Fodinibius sp. TaxID=1872440 RepID=UPI002ACE1DB9|nr:histidine kinase dimerization/phosphoacceptor domain -containing protein [Fodinibius sp.]MDZ7658145.1 histidine kinase dimerization/phosphoacceptor domain -containing protein [Fodinibius sp.]
MKLSTKLIGSFSIVVLFMGGIGLTASYFNDVVKDQVTFESEKAIQEVTLAGELGLQLFKSLTRTQYLLEDSYRETLSMDYSRSNRTKEVQIAEIDKSLEEFEKSLEELRTLVKSNQKNIFEPSADTSKVLSLLENLEKKYKNYSALLTQFQNISTKNYQDRKEFFTVTIEPYFRSNLLPEIDQLRNHIQQTHQQQIAGLNSQLDRVGYILVIATGIALIIAIVLSLFIYRSIANPIAKIADAAQSVGQGNLQNRIDYDSNDELGQLSSTFDQMAENLSRTTVSRDYVDSIIEAMADLLVVTDEDLKITRVNSAVSDILGYTEEELLDKTIDTLFNEVPDETFKEQHTDSNKTYTGELIGKNENVIPVSISRGKIRDKDRTVEGYVFVASDISSEKKAQQKITESLREKEVLLAEIHHRVKNNLAVISGLLQMQMWESENENAKSALQQSHLRVQSIALVHEKLYQSESLSYIQFDRYLQDLLQTIADIYIGGESDIDINSNLNALTLNVNQAIPCALLINELVINAFKYAFEDTDEGTINILVQKDDQQVLVKVSDNGHGFDEGNDLGDNPSLGLELVDTLVEQLNGELKLYNRDGAHIEFRFTPEGVSNTT